MWHLIFAPCSWSKGGSQGHPIFVSTLRLRWRAEVGGRVFYLNILFLLSRCVLLLPPVKPCRCDHFVIASEIASFYLLAPFYFFLPCFPGPFFFFFSSFFSFFLGWIDFEVIFTDRRVISVRRAPTHRLLDIQTPTSSPAFDFPPPCVFQRHRFRQCRPRARCAPRRCTRWTPRSRSPTAPFTPSVSRWVGSNAYPCRCRGWVLYRYDVERGKCAVTRLPVPVILIDFLLTSCPPLSSYLSLSAVLQVQQAAGQVIAQGGRREALLPARLYQVHEGQPGLHRRLSIQRS